MIKKFIVVFCFMTPLMTCAMDQEPISEWDCRIRDLAYANMMHEVSPAERERGITLLAAECIAEELQKDKESGWKLVRPKKWKRAVKKDVENGVDWYEYDYILAQLR